MAITKVIDPIPEAPQRGVDTQEQFDQKADAFLKRLETLDDDLNEWKDQCNATAQEVNENAQVASEAREVCEAIGASNGYKGEWDSGTTYAQGDVVSYSGHLWLSKQDNNLGNIPSFGSSTYWMPIIGIDVPVGAILAFASDTPPDGWLECNGAEVSRTDYADLFNVIGTTFGAGDGSTTFNLPDLRGEFIRGWDNGRGVDSERVFGSWQADELRSHNHSIQGNNYSGEIIVTIEGSSSQPLHTAYTGYTGGSETRPRNVALMFCIKY